MNCEISDLVDWNVVGKVKPYAKEGGVRQEHIVQLIQLTKKMIQNKQREISPEE